MGAALLFLFTMFLDGIFNLAGTGVSVSAQQEIAEQQIASQEKINKENIKLAKEINQSQIDESEKAYQRSTIQSQIDQFIAAGLSPQQARQVVLGASPGQYSPATLNVPQADASGINAAYEGMSNAVASANLGSAFSSVASDLTNSFNSPDGGSIGAFIGNDAAQFLTEHLHELSPAERSFFGFMNYLDGDNIPDHFKEFKDSDAWKRVLKSMNARKFINSFFKQSYQFSADDYSLALAHFNAQDAAIRTNLHYLTFDSSVRQAEAQATIAQLDANFKDRVNEASIEAALAKIRSDMEDSNLLYQLRTNPEYRDNYLKNACLDVSLAAVLKTVALHKGNSQLAWINDPANARFVAIGEMYQNCGLTGTDWMNIIAYADARGMDTSGMIDAAQSSLQGVSSVAQGAADAVSSIVEKGKKLFTPGIKNPYDERKYFDPDYFLELDSKFFVNRKVGESSYLKYWKGKGFHVRDGKVYRYRAK